jgi:calcineurin-like phosphoesterase family protein
MTRFTAHLYSGHANVIKLRNRPFQSAPEMDEALIANRNAAVKGNDDVHTLGDLFYHSVAPDEDTLKRLKGRKHLILGNYDNCWIIMADPLQYFAEVTDLLTYKRRRLSPV